MKAGSVLRLAFLAFSCFADAACAQELPGMTASPAAAFLDSVGVNLHAGWPGTSAAVLGREVEFLGLHLIRDSIDGAMSFDGMDEIDRGAAGAFKWDIIVDQNPVSNRAWLEQRVGNIASLEGPNEPNFEHFKYEGLEGVEAAAALQHELFGMVQEDPALQGTEVLNYAMGYHATYEQQLNLAKDYDSGNLHAYAASGRPPGARLFALLGDAHVAAQNKIVITETGYTTVAHNAVSARGGLEGVDEQTQAKYALDSMFDDFSFGVPKTYLFELRDDYPDPQETNKERHFGLFRSDDTPKLAAIAVHNLFAVLADPSPHAALFTPRPLAVEIEHSPLVKTVLLEKASGEYELVAWAEPDIWSARVHAAAPAANAYQVAVKFGDFYYDVDVYDPVLQAGPVNSEQHVKGAVFQVVDHPMILQIKKESEH